MTAPLQIVTAEGRITVSAGTIVTVGRHSSSTIRLDDPRVSREHARVYVSGEGWVVEDVQSRFGTYVDGQRLDRLGLEGETTVRLGDPHAGPWLRLATAPDDEAAPQPSLGPALEAGTVMIGRSATNDLVLDDPLVSRRHAELRRLPDGRAQIVDVGSFNGTFVNGSRVDEAELRELDLVGIGSSEFRFVGSRLEQVAAKEAVALAAVGITVVSRAGAVLADDVSFALDEGSLLAVVGPSGAGKSTLLGAITGLKPAPRGSVYFGARDLYAEYDDLRQRIGFVPQDDVVHPELTVAESLEYAAELRFAPDVTREERRARVEEVMAELDLSARRGLPVRKLSGGQRKRVSVALELLTKPTLLFLDEPASGLDPGLERSVMELLRGLADSGRTVVVVTHSTESLNLCDRVLFLAPGGRTAFFGPPQRAIAYFERSDYQEVFRDLSDRDPEEWKAAFAADDLAQRYLHEPLSGYTAGIRQPASIAGALGQQTWWRQFWMLTRRYVRVLAGDRATLAALLGAAPLLGLLALWRLPDNELSSLPTGQIRVVSQASLVLLVIALGVTLLGLSNALREIVKDLPVFRRERAVGLSISAYILSKAVVLGAITALQAIVYVSITLAQQGGPDDAVLLGWPLGELIVAAAATGIAAVALGLLASSAVSSTNAAVALLPILLIGQLHLMSGGVFPENKPVLRELGYTASAGWGFAATGSTVKLNELQTLNNAAGQVPILDVEEPGETIEAIFKGGRGDPLWNHEPVAWLRAMAALAAITATCLVLAGVALRRFDPL